MFTRRKSYNPKRKIDSGIVESELKRLEEEVRYGGNPEHKKNPGDFGLTPPAAPRRGKTLCDEAGIFARKEALMLLQDGIRKGLISRHKWNDYPQNVWTVSGDDIPLEAELENRGDGTYHGYPMPEDDPFRPVVLAAWKAANERNNAH